MISENSSKLYPAYHKRRLSWIPICVLVAVSIWFIFADYPLFYGTTNWSEEAEEGVERRNGDAFLRTHGVFIREARRTNVAVREVVKCPVTKILIIYRTGFISASGAQQLRYAGAN